MRRAVRWAMLLYPAAWRERYGREFAALLEDVQPGGWELWDVVAGALKMQAMSWSWRKTAAAFTVAGALAAGVVAARMPNEYISTAVMRMAGGGDAGRPLLRAQQEVLSRTSLAAIISQHDLYREERSRLPLEDIVMAMRDHHIRIRRLGSADSFYVSFEYPDRATAQQVTRELADGILLAANRREATLEVLDPASLPQKPAYPNRPAIVVLGLALGLLAGLVVLGVKRWPLVAVCGTVAALAALAIAYAIPNRWLSTAVLQLDRGADAAQLVHDALTDATLGEIIQQPNLNLYASERQRMPMAEVVRRMRDRDLRVTPIRGNTQPGIMAFEIGFMGRDRRQTQAVVRVLVARLAEHNVVAARNRPANLEVLDPASLPERPFWPNRSVILAIGLGVGLVGGAVVTRRRRLKVTTAAV